VIRTNSDFPAVMDRRYRQTFQADVALASEVGSQWSDQSPFPIRNVAPTGAARTSSSAIKRFLREIDHR